MYSSKATLELPNVFANWKTPPSIMPFADLEPDAHQKQFSDFETSSCIDQASFINPSTSFLGISSCTTDNFFPSSFPYNHEYHQNGFIKRENSCLGLYEGGYCYSSKGTLNLGHRSYFPSRETSLIDRLFNRSRGFYQVNRVPLCQAEGCKADLTNAKHYHRRHKVCEFHSKATKVVAGGIEQRFCQQCSRFHVLAEFDESKRSCRKRLADHNRRRRKPHSSGKSVANFTNATEKPPSATLPLLVEKGEEAKRKEDILDQWQQKNEPGLSLGGFVQIDGSSFFPSSWSILSGRDRSSTTTVSTSQAASNASCVVVGSCYHEQSQQQQPIELQNLLHLGHQAMFEVGELML